METREKAGAAGYGLGALIGAVVKMGYYIAVALAAIKYLRGA